MTKKIGIIAITIYQILISPILKVFLGEGKFCRFEETCSDYTKRKINEEGLIYGTMFGIVRLSKCNPFYNMEGAK